VRPERQRGAFAVNAGLQGRARGVFEPAAAGERWLRVPLTTLHSAATQLRAEGARFVTLFAAERDGRSLVVLFAYRGELVALCAPLPTGAAAFASLARELPAATWPERELHDNEGLMPLAHPDLEPLRADADAIRRRIVGPETFVLPYGPIRSGIFEAIQFVIETGGEDVLDLQVRTQFKRRGLEQRFAGLPLQHGAYLAERVAGIASVAHALAFAQAVERALEVEPPLRALLWRAVYAELERVANHFDVAAHLAEDPALAVGAARFAILKEDVLRLQALLTGSRFARGMIIVGGVHAEPYLAPDELGQALAALERDLMRDRKLLLRTTSFTDRLIGSGRLDRETVERFGGIGPVARAAGLSTDARFERPYAAYGRLGFEVITRERGDAMARLEVRFGEIAQSLHLIRQALDRLRREQSDLSATVPSGEGQAFGWAEAPQGELVYWLDVAGGFVRQARIASPSGRNWPLFAESFRGDVLTDFAFIEHSFGLTPAGADR
jgi:formate hydrogenlyase subunit 5